MTDLTKLAAFSDEWQKIAKIMGASPPDEDFMVSTLPHERKETALQGYWKRKGREKPSSWGAALGGGGLIGGGLGAIIGLAARKPGQGAAIGAALGGLSGAGLGAVIRLGDKAEIERSRRRSKKGRSYLRSKTESKVVGAHAAQRARAALRHYETMSAIRDRDIYR